MSPYSAGIHPFAKQLERLEDMILSGMSIPLTSWTVVNGDELVPLLDALRETLPEELRKAQEQVAHRDVLLKETEARARQMIEETHQYAEQLVQESEIMKAVHAEADRVRQLILHELETARRQTEAEAEAVKRQAYEEAKAIVEGAEAYAANLLISLDKQLADCQHIVRNGQRALRQRITGTKPQEAPQKQRASRAGLPPKLSEDVTAYR
jgi:hypothetical protein